MHLAINIESNRLQASTVDLDGNVIVYKIGDGLNSTKTEIPCNIYIKGINAYVGDIVETIKYEDPNIQTAEAFVMELSNSDFIYEDDSQRNWNALFLLGLIIRKLRKDIEINTMQTIQTCNLAISSLYHEINHSDLRTAVQYNKLKLLKSYEHNFCSSLYILHNYEIKDPASIFHFYADWNYIQLDLTEVSENQITSNSVKKIKIDSIERIREYINEYIKRSYQEQMGEEIVLHASNSVVINELVKSIINKFYVRNETDYKNYAIINNNIISVNIVKSDLDEVNNNVRAEIINAYKLLIDSNNIEEETFDYLVFTGKLGSLYFFREIFENLESASFNQKIFSPKNDIIIKGLALFSHEPYKNIVLENKEEVDTNKDGLHLKISSSGIAKSYNISSLLNYDKQAITITNLLDDGIIKNLSEEDCEFEVVERSGNTDRTIGHIKLDLPSNYTLTHFQLSCGLDENNKLKFKAEDVFNNQNIELYFHQDKQTKSVKLNGNKSNGIVKVKSGVGKIGRIKVLSKNGIGLSGNGSVNENSPKRIKIAAGVNEESSDRIKIKISKDDLKEKSNLEISTHKIGENENTIVEDFHELIRIIVINNSP